MSTTTDPLGNGIIAFIDADGWINRRPDADERIEALNAQPSDCGACGQTFPNLDEVFSHPCPALGNGRPVALDADTDPADDVDYRPTNGTGTGRPATSVRPNRFAGECAHCGRRIAAEAGELRKGPNGWQVIHLAGECAADHDEVPAPTPAPAEPRSSSCKPNRFAGSCHRCGGHVAAEAGFLCRIDNKWAVEHNGSCPETAAATPAPAASNRPRTDVPAGRYAIDSTGSNDLVFYRVDRPTEGPYAGRVFVKMIVGGHADQNVAWRNVPGILDRIADAGVMEATIRYGHELGECGHCGRHLTDEASRAAGIGPVCAARLGW